MKAKIEKLKRRHRRIRAKVSGTAERPRFQVFRSLNYTYAQLIDDTTGKTILSASDRDSKVKENKTKRAFEVGKEIAKNAKEKKINEVVFDRKGYMYHGRVKAVAEGAREEGLKF